MELTGRQYLATAQLAATTLVTDLLETDPQDGDHVVPGELRRFLAGLRLLHGVPFSYLVPDAELLPPESIRFFYVDRSWTDAAVQGALSVGTVTTTDRALLEAAYPTLRDEVDESERTLRTPSGEELLQGAGGTVTGFLLRSRVVSGWPALHVRAYAGDEVEDRELSTVAESHPSRLKVLRMERLAPAVLLVLVDGVPDLVHIEEPRQGVQFGIRMDTDAPPEARRAELPLRHAATGDPLEPERTVTVPFRAGAPGVIDVGRLRDRMTDVPEAGLGESVETHEFVLEMLRFPYRQVFGDPEGAPSSKFYDLDQFHVTVRFDEWHAHLSSLVEDVGDDEGGPS